MKDVLSFYLDETIVQAVTASVTDGRIAVSDAVTFPYEELENYLSTCGEKNCIVCCNPSSFYQDIVYLPVAAAKYYENLIRADIFKKHTDLHSFTFFHRTTGEKTIDGVLNSKIAVFSYANEILSQYIEPFHRNKKIILHLYAAPYPVFRLATQAYPAESSEERLIIADLPGEKLILLSEKDELEFIRKIQSLEHSIQPVDVENINMTIDYCFQTLRVKPNEAVIFNPSKIEQETSLPLEIPLKSICPAALSSLPDDIFLNYIAPLAATVHFYNSPKECDILPSDYAAFLQNKRILAGGVILIAALAVILAGFTMSDFLMIAKQNARIGALREHLRNHDAEVTTYKQLDQEVKSLESSITFLNKQNNTLNPEIALAALTPPLTSGYSFKGMTFKKGDNNINVHIDGIISATGYKETQSVFEMALEHIKKIPGYSVVSSVVDIKLKTFSVEANYMNTGRQGL